MGIPAAAVPAAAATTMTCGTVVTRSATLANDVGPCEEDGLIIAASGITLDLGGHRVLGTYDPHPATPPDEEGITFRNVRRSAVRNGEVTHFSTGVIISKGSQNTVSQLNVHDNIGRSAAGDGIAVYASDSNRIANNRVVHNGPASGITLLGEGSVGSRDNEIADNLVLDNNLPELNDEGRPDWKRDVGIAVEGPGATHNRILRNTVEGSGLHGINVFPACSTGYDITTGCPGTVPNEYNVIRGNNVTATGSASPWPAPPSVTASRSWPRGHGRW